MSQNHTSKKQSQRQCLNIDSTWIPLVRKRKINYTKYKNVNDNQSDERQFIMIYENGVK